MLWLIVHLFDGNCVSLFLPVFIVLQGEAINLLPLCECSDVQKQEKDLDCHYLSISFAHFFFLSFKFMYFVLTLSTFN